ncbi:MAG: winged helix DNA-binding domain-containing protein [Mobilicoccus sp.]|nr:winged helix DNA-binding domain-containing protein [Mobilicoccus sp.]
MLTLADVARMRLISSGLVEPFPTVVDVVRHLTCTQGQDLPGSTRSIALRTTGRSLAEVRAAYDDGAIVRSWPMRGTLFVVAAEDLAWIRDLTAAKMMDANARRRDELGLSPEILAQGRRIAVEAVSDVGLTRAELLARWTAEGIDVEGGRGYHLLSHLALSGVLCLGPFSGTDQRFVLTDTWIPTPRVLDRDDAVRELLYRYIAARGPVPLDDFCWWSKLGKREARAALADVAPTLRAAHVDGIDGVEFWMAPDLPDRDADLRRAAEKPLLLPGFDEIVLGYGDRRAVLTREEELLVVPGRNGVFKPTVIDRGRAVGTWSRPTRKGASADVAPFTTLRAPVARAIPRLTAALPT